MKIHRYETHVAWEGNLGDGTAGYQAYSRNHRISISGKPDIPGTSDPAFRGDPSRYSPEDLLVSSLSACHMLWYLHLCAVNGVVVVNYTDTATGEMQEEKDGSGVFKEVILRPKVSVRDGLMLEKARTLHEEAHRMCFIARSVNFRVLHEPDVTVANGQEARVSRPLND